MSAFLDATFQSMDSSDLSDGPITLQEYLEVKKALASSEAKVQQLMKVNNNLSEELRRLQKEVRMNRCEQQSKGHRVPFISGSHRMNLHLTSVRHKCLFKNIA